MSYWCGVIIGRYLLTYLGYYLKILEKSIKFVVGPSQGFTAYMVDLNQCLCLPLHDIEDGTTAETFMNYYLGNIQKSVHLQK